MGYLRIASGYFYSAIGSPQCVSRSSLLIFVCVTISQYCVFTYHIFGLSTHAYEFPISLCLSSNLSAAFCFAPPALIDMPTTVCLSVYLLSDLFYIATLSFGRSVFRFCYACYNKITVFLLHFVWPLTCWISVPSADVCWLRRVVAAHF